MTVAEDAAIEDRAWCNCTKMPAAKPQSALEDAENRLQGLIRDFHFQRERSAQRQTLAALEAT